MCFIQGCAALFLFVADIPTDMIPDRFTAILTSGIGFFTAYGIKSRSIWGLYLVYLLCIIYGIVCLYMVLEGNEISQYQGFAGMIIYLLWGLYFNKRKSMFS